MAWRFTLCHEPDRSRKLLLNKREIDRLSKAVHAKGRTLVPLRMFFNARGLVKLKIGVGRGKSDYDKRQDIKKEMSIATSLEFEAR